MIYRKLGKTGLSVSTLSYGTMRLPINPTNPNFTEAITLIEYAHEKGINYFDVGTFYCHHYAETAFGLATKDIPRENIIITGKNSSHQSGATDWIGQLKNSLSLFERDYFDIYFLHYLNLEHWENHFLGKGIIDQIQQAKNQGLIHHLGFSSHDTPENVSDLIDSDYFEAIILPYNLIQRKYENTMKYAHQKELGVIVMNPLGGGALSNSQLYFENSQTEQDKNKTAELALNFVLSQPFVHTALSGMESKAIIEENIKTVHKKRLSFDDISALNERISHEKAKLLVPCTGCNYCMPCVQGIDIPAVIEIWNQYSILKGKKIFARDYAELPVPAECCIQCDSCNSNCPCNIPITDIMEQTARLFCQI